MAGRLKFDKKILKQIFCHLSLSTKELAQQTGRSFHAIKNWRSGSCTIPVSFFEQLCIIKPELKEYQKKAKPLESNWGNLLGGKNRISKMNREQISKNMHHVRRGRGKNFPNIDDINIANPLALEFYGVMMGDGCVSRYHIKSSKNPRTAVVISGNSKKDREYFDDFLIPTINQLFGVKIKTKKRKDQNTIDLVTCASHVSQWLIKHEFPIGKKHNLQIPPHIMSMSLEKRNIIIRGLLDTDVCIAARKDEDYKYQYIFIWAKNKKLRVQLKEILREQGIPAYLHGDSVVVRGCNNFKIWFKKIGSSNLRNIKKYMEWINTKRIRPTGL